MLPTLFTFFALLETSRERSCPIKPHWSSISDSTRCGAMFGIWIKTLIIESVNIFAIVLFLLIPFPTKTFHIGDISSWLIPSVTISLRSVSDGTDNVSIQLVSLPMPMFVMEACYYLIVRIFNVLVSCDVLRDIFCSLGTVY